MEVKDNFDLVAGRPFHKFLKLFKQNVFYRFENKQQQQQIWDNY